MAADRFIYWKKGERKPTRKEIGIVCEDYCKGMGKVQWENGRYVVIILPGTPTRPL